MGLEEALKIRRTELHLGLAPLPSGSTLKLSNGWVAKTFRAAFQHLSQSYPLVSTTAPTPSPSLPESLLPPPETPPPLALPSTSELNLSSQTAIINDLVSASAQNTSRLKSKISSKKRKLSEMRSQIKSQDAQIKLKDDRISELEVKILRKSEVILSLIEALKTTM